MLTIAIAMRNASPILAVASSREVRRRPWAELARGQKETLGGARASSEGDLGGGRVGLAVLRLAHHGRHLVT
jgi:hypothetical protein